jgi:hypothetical protein
VDTLDPSQVEAVRALFAQHGVAGDDVRVAVPLGDDEAVFVLSTEAAAGMQERDLTLALTDLLGRKVWVATDGAIWEGRTQPLT